jgi:hypothetical protein
MTEIMLEQFPPCHTAASGELHYFLIDLMNDPLLAFETLDQLGNSVGMQPKVAHLAPEDREQLLHSRPIPLGKIFRALSGIDLLSA